MAYAYLDQYKILHVVDKEETAKQYASSKVVATDIPNGGGYPEFDEKHVIVYTADGKFKVGGADDKSKAGGKEYPLDKLKDMYPQVAALVKEIEEA